MQQCMWQGLMREGSQFSPALAIIVILLFLMLAYQRLFILRSCNDTLRNRKNFPGRGRDPMIINGIDIRPGAYLRNTDLRNTDLTGANLSDADLSDADLSWANLTGATLTNADLTNANLTGASLSWANLTGANLTGANLSWANLRGASLRYGLASATTKWPTDLLAALGVVIK